MEWTEPFRHNGSEWNARKCIACRWWRRELKYTHGWWLQNSECMRLRWIFVAFKADDSSWTAAKLSGRLPSVVPLLVINWKRMNVSAPQIRASDGDERETHTNRLWNRWRALSVSHLQRHLDVRYMRFSFAISLCEKHLNFVAQINYILQTPAQFIVRTTRDSCMHTYEQRLRICRATSAQNACTTQNANEKHKRLHEPRRVQRRVVHM